MKNTKNLGLPIYDNPKSDLFKISDVNNAHTIIDETYETMKNAKEHIVEIDKNIPIKNADAEIVDARIGKSTLGDKIREIDSSLENKLNKGNVSISDINKNFGKLDQSYMADEFLQQIVGNASVNSIPHDNSVTSEKLADCSVIASKLSSQFRYKKYLNASENLNTIIDDGLYYCNNVINKPSELSLCVLEVLKVYERWVIQKLYDFNNPSVIYSRRIDQNTFTPTEWVKNVDTSDISHLDNNKIGSRGNATNIDTTTTQGTYLVLASCLGTFPNKNWEIGRNAGTLFVTNDNNRFVTQFLIKLNTPSDCFLRTIDTKTGDKSEWCQINNKTSHLHGKNIVCFGDSITEFGNYPEVISAMTGATVYNVGFGGTRMAKHETSTQGKIYDKMCMYNLSNYIYNNNFSELKIACDNLFTSVGDDNREIADRLSKIDFNKVDIITIMLGTNDYCPNDINVPIGENIDIKEDGSTFKGAINYIIKQILSKYPKIKIAFVTPIYRNRYKSKGDGLNSDIHVNEFGRTLLDYSNAIKDVCNINHIPFIDLYSNSCINKYTSNHYLSSDELHPSIDGYIRIGECLASSLLSIF